MAKQGWIKLHRQILESDIWIRDKDEKFDRRSAWIDLLLLSNHEDRKVIFDGSAVDVKRGQFITSVRKLSERWGWGNAKTLKFLKMLEDLKMIEKNSNNRRTLITIVNYSFFQDGANTDGTQTDTQTERRPIHRPTTNKNIKNDKNENNYYLAKKSNPSYKDFEQNVYDFDEIEKKHRKN